MFSKHFIPILGLCALFPMSLSAQFVADDFNDGVLGSQWTFGDSTPAGSTATEVDGYAVLEAVAGTDHYYHANTYAYIEQPAPEGTNWEIITKIDDFDPLRTGEQRGYTRVGIQLWQDNNHFVTLSTLSSEFGTDVNSQCLWQFDPDSAPEGEAGIDTRRGELNLIAWPPEYDQSLWMKLQSTPRGYRGFIATGSGNNWLECLNIVRNPYTESGLLENPKFRLFMAGGFEHSGGGQEATPAKFDFVEYNSLPEPLPYTDDEFDGTDIDVDLKSNWDINLGIAPGIAALNAGSLYLTAGEFSNLWDHIEQPLYIFQDAPTSASYALTTKVGPLDMLMPFEIWNSYGIWLWKDQNNWILISNSRTDQNQGGVWVDVNRIEAAAKFNDQFANGETIFTGLAPAYLRVVRDGINTQVEHSFDGETWVPFEFNIESVPTVDIPIGSDDMQVRLFSKRVYGTNDHDEDNPPLDAQFEWLTSEERTASVGGWELY